MNGAQVFRHQVFRHPIGGFERALRKIYDRVMRGLGRVPYTAHAQGARFVVDTTDLIDRELAINAIWEAPQLEDFATLCTYQARGGDHLIQAAFIESIERGDLGKARDAGRAFITFHLALLPEWVTISGLDWSLDSIDRQANHLLRVSRTLGYL